MIISTKRKVISSQTFIKKKNCSDLPHIICAVMNIF